MIRAKNAGLVICLFALYCVLLSQGLKAGAGSTLLGALAAVPLTVHLYHRVWPTVSKNAEEGGSGKRRAVRCAGESASEYSNDRDPVESRSEN
jgi:hypothetical protein